MPFEKAPGGGHVGQLLVAAKWRRADSDFALLLGMRKWDTEEYSVRLFFLDQQGLKSGPLLFTEPTTVAYDGLLGDLATSTGGTIALAYRSPNQAGPVSIALVRGHSVEDVPLQSEHQALFTPPLLAAFPRGTDGRFALVFGTGASDPGIPEHALLMRCDLAE